MNDLTPYQRDILIAMLQGKRIELESTPTEFIAISYAWIFKHYFYHEPERLRISPNQDEAVRLYGFQGTVAKTWCFDEINPAYA